MTYKVTAVSGQVREFGGQYGEMKSYKIKLEGVEAAVELAQKAATPAPYVGQSIDGTIDMSGQYGPKFKKEYGGGAPARSFGGGKDQDIIRAQWAIGQAITVAVGTNSEFETDNVEAMAIEFFDMAERVKSSAKVDTTSDPFDNPSEELFPPDPEGF